MDEALRSNRELRDAWTKIHVGSSFLTSLADAGLRLEFLHEFDFVRWPVDFLVESEDGLWRLPRGSKGGLPLFFSLKATKPLPHGA